MTSAVPVIDVSKLTEDELTIYNILFAQVEAKLAAKTGKKKTVVKNTLKPYTIRVVNFCKTCGSSKTTFYDMVPDKDNVGLVSVKVSVDEERSIYTDNNRQSSTCTECKEYLMSLTKEELVTRLLKALVN